MRTVTRSDNFLAHQDTGKKKKKGPKKSRSFLKKILVYITSEVFHCQMVDRNANGKSWSWNKSATFNQSQTTVSSINKGFMLWQTLFGSLQAKLIKCITPMYSLPTLGNFNKGVFEGYRLLLRLFFPYLCGDFGFILKKQQLLNVRRYLDSKSAGKKTQTKPNKTKLHTTISSESPIKL